MFHTQKGLREMYGEKVLGEIERRKIRQKKKKEEIKYGSPFVHNPPTLHTCCFCLECDRNVI